MSNAHRSWIKSDDDLKVIVEREGPLLATLAAEILHLRGVLRGDRFNVPFADTIPYNDEDIRWFAALLNFESDSSD